MVFLFSSKPWNANHYALVHFDVNYIGNPIDPPKSVLDEGVGAWSDYLVGFRYGTINYMAVKAYIDKMWKLKGFYETFSDKKLLFQIFNSRGQVVCTA